MTWTARLLALFYIKMSRNGNQTVKTSTPDQQRNIPPIRNPGIPVEETEKEISDVETKEGQAVRNKRISRERRPR